MKLGMLGLLSSGAALSWLVMTQTCLPQAPKGVWELHDSPTTEALWSLQMLGPEDGWAVGENGAIVHYSNGSWSLIPSPSKKALYGVAFVDADLGWAVGDGGVILQYVQGRWEAVASPVTRSLNSIDMIDRESGWAVGDQGTVVRYNGQEWRPVFEVTDADLTAVAMQDRDHGIVTGRTRDLQGVILRYTKDSWEQLLGPAPQLFHDVGIEESGTVWAAGEERELSPNGIFMSLSQNRWKSIVTKPRVFGLYLGPEDGWAVGENGAIWHHLAGGSWVNSSSPSTQTLLDVEMTGLTDGWAVGMAGTILHYHTEAATPTATTAPSSTPTPIAPTPEPSLVWLPWAGRPVH